jgi:serine/threonine protein kinase
MSQPSSDISSGLLSPPGTPTRKPPHPYIARAVFTAKRHQPPAPFGGRYSRLSSPNPDELLHSNQVEWCRSHPPLPGETHSEDTRRIVIKDALRNGTDCGAQVLITEDGQVAKVYDPLYYAFATSDRPDRKRDVTTHADSEYSIESAAYSELQHSAMQGGIMPNYYGSWTLDLTIDMDGQEVAREVRMIIIEHVPGVQMLQLDPDDLSERERENIMRKVIEADYDLREAGVLHEDVSPRNIMISQASSFSDPDLRVTFVDYGSSTVYRICYDGPTLPEYQNPLFEWTAASMWSSWGWLPLEDEERVRWMWNIWGDGNEGRYVKVNRDPDNALGGPKRPDAVSEDAMTDT